MESPNNRQVEIVLYREVTFIQRSFNTHGGTATSVLYRGVLYLECPLLGGSTVVSWRRGRRLPPTWWWCAGKYTDKSNNVTETAMSLYILCCLRWQTTTPLLCDTPPCASGPLSCPSIMSKTTPCCACAQGNYSLLYLYRLTSSTP